MFLPFELVVWSSTCPEFVRNESLVNIMSFGVGSLLWEHTLALITTFKAGVVLSVIEGLQHFRRCPYTKKLLRHNRNRQHDDKGSDEG